MLRSEYIKNMLKKKYNWAVTFNDNTCPVCGNKSLSIINVRDRESIYYHSHFECKECGFTCPIYHDCDTEKPMYSDELYNFSVSFKKN